MHPKVQNLSAFSTFLKTESEKEKENVCLPNYNFHWHFLLVLVAEGKKTPFLGLSHVCTWSTSGASAPLRGRSTCGVSALGRGESTFGSTAPGRGNDFLLYIGEKNFCARARRIHLWSTAPERGNDFLLYIGEKIFCARARRIHLWIYRARARKRFSSLYRGENFLRSGAENPPLDLPRPSAETIFFSI